MRTRAFHPPLAALAAAVSLATISGPVPAYDHDDRGDGISDEAFLEIARDSFYYEKEAHFQRLIDPTLATCNATHDHPDAEQSATILEREREAIVYPEDGELMGDWKRGKQWSEDVHGGRIGYPGFADADDPSHANGANCYACHAIDPGFPQAGNMGPPLTGYGRMRGQSERIVKYTYDKIYNSKASVPCSLMPRYGGEDHLLTPEQVADLVAFLLDPESPVNRETDD